MAGKNNAKCKICGRDYYMCLSCKSIMSASPWKVHTDTSEHYKIYQILRGYKTKVYTKDETKNKLNSVDLSDLNTFKPGIKSMIDDILKEDKPVMEIIEKVKDSIKIEANVEPEIVETSEVTEEELVIEKPVYSRKRNYKANKLETDENVENE